MPLGRPIPHVQLVIADDVLHLRRPGCPGELCIGGAGVGAGYINEPEMTAAKFPPNPFSFVAGTRIYRTGDRVRMLPDGNLEFLGRLDHQVKIRGFRGWSARLRQPFTPHPDIQSAVVIAREDQAARRILAAYFVPRRQPAPTSPSCAYFLRAKLPKNTTWCRQFSIPGILPAGDPNGRSGPERVARRAWQRTR